MTHALAALSLQPTTCHYFIRLLKEKGLLLRCYTQVGVRVASREEGPGTCLGMHYSWVHRTAVWAAQADMGTLLTSQVPNIRDVCIPLRV